MQLQAILLVTLAANHGAQAGMTVTSLTQNVKSDVYTVAASTCAAFSVYFSTDNDGKDRAFSVDIWDSTGNAEYAAAGLASFDGTTIISSPDDMVSFVMSLNATGKSTHHAVF